ncbi:thioredoxin family protein [Haloplanus halobius]|uniref:thioredoxin family protein n=1 Tax=Haloplanus halobius TaxID=2934938 RepID=UPI00200F90C3|nr:thioredoxin family protein [Haloplanus sp. XH21]
MALQESDSELEYGDEAPGFELPGVNGETYTLDDFDADALLVVFTCNHCPYAQAKFDLLNDLAREDDVAVVGINANDADAYPEDSFQKMQEYVADGEIAYDAYLRDESADVARTYGAVCTPDPFLFRRDEGTYRLAYHGRLDDALGPDEEASEYYIRQAIDAVRADEPVDIDPGPSRGCGIKWP